MIASSVSVSPAVSAGPLGALAHESSQVAGPIQAHQQLADQALLAGRLTAGLQRVHGDRGDGGRRLGDREPVRVDPLGWREEPPARHVVRVTGAAGQRRQCLVRARAWAAGHVAAGRDQFQRSF